MTNESGTQADAQQSRSAGEPATAAQGQVRKAEATPAPSEPTPQAEGASGTTSRNAGPGIGSERDAENEAEDQKVSAEEFAREHDPAKHDIAAGDEARQHGDWTADHPDGRVWDDEGTLLVEGTSPHGSATAQGDSHDVTAQSDPAGGGRRTSSLDEIRDGGYSVGSAALIDDGAIPLGHPVKAWEDTKTFLTPDDPGYNASEPHLWFTDAGAAGRAGFRPAG